MRFGSIFAILLVIIVALVIVAVILANQRPGVSSVQPLPPSNVRAVPTTGGYLLSWNAGKNATAYNLYIFDNLSEVTDSAVQSIQNVQSPYFFEDKYLTEGNTYIGLTSVRNYANGELESRMCKIYLLPQGTTNLSPPILNCQGAYNFDGQFEATAETCFQQASDDRIVIRWFPVTGATGYKVRYHQGGAPYNQQTIDLGSTAYQYLSPSLSPSSCWVFTVTAVDDRGRESGPSQTFTTCTA